MNAEVRRAVFYFLLSPALLLSPKGRARRRRKLHLVALELAAPVAEEEPIMNTKTLRTLPSCRRSAAGGLSTFSPNGRAG